MSNSAYHTIKLTLLKSSVIDAESFNVTRGKRARCLYLATIKSCLVGLREREREREREMIDDNVLL